jgi:hypothetical protein
MDARALQLVSMRAAGLVAVVWLLLWLWLVHRDLQRAARPSAAASDTSNGNLEKEEQGSACGPTSTQQRQRSISPVSIRRARSPLASLRPARFCRSGGPARPRPGRPPTAGCAAPRDSTARSMLADGLTLEGGEGRRERWEGSWSQRV